MSSARWYHRLRGASSHKSHQAKHDYQKIAMEIKRFQQTYEKKDKHRVSSTANQREEFLSKALDLWTRLLLPYWNKYDDLPRAEHSEIYKLWWHGLPPKIRGVVWKLAIGNELEITYELFTQFQLIAQEKLNEIKQYQLESGRTNTNGSPSSLLQANDNTHAYFEFIQLDVSRTFPQLGLFQSGGPLYDNLQLLLCIYVYFSSDIGYVQGHAFLAAMFLLNLDLFDSFVCFSNLLNRRYFQTFYRFKSMDEYFQLLNHLIAVHLPRLSGHFSAMSIEPQCFALDWFFTIYAKSLPLDFVVRLWDLFFRDGEVLIYRVALAILSIYEEHLCQLDTFHCLQFLTRLPENIDGTMLFDRLDRIHLQASDSEYFELIG